MTMLRVFFSRLGTAAAIGAMLSAPAQAATFAEARSEIQLNHFRLDGAVLSPLLTDATTITDTIAVGNLSPSATVADAEALFQVNPPVVQGFSSGTSVGLGDRPYQGQSEAAAQAFGDFAVKGLFEFDFTAALGLQTDVDFLANERAAAGGQAQFELYANNPNGGSTLLDSFTLSGILASFSDVDSIGSNATSHVMLNPNTACFGARDANGLCREQSLGGNTEFAIASATGTYRRQFDELTSITLLKTQSTITAVQEVPEAGSGLAFLTLGLAWCLLQHRKDEQSAEQPWNQL